MKFRAFALLVAIAAPAALAQTQYLVRAVEVVIEGPEGTSPY